MESRWKPRLWITYAGVDNQQGNFDYLTQELGNVGIEARYDKIALIPGQRLWDQIAQEITQSPIGGWASLVTANSLTSQACQEELSYALKRALEAKGAVFPLV